MKNRLLIIAGGVALALVGFQNCSKAQFSSTADSSLEKGNGAQSVLVPMEEDGDYMGNVTMPALGNNNAPHPRGPGRSTEGDEEEGSSAGDYVACILVDHGKSLKLGLIEGAAGGVHSVAESVCIPRATCLIEVAKHFAVEGAYDRGYCEHNPHVRRLTDLEVKNLLKTNP